MSHIKFKISVPTDEGFIGRECNSNGCKRYFRVRGDSIKNYLYCPYCGVRHPNDHLHTKDQVKHLRQAAEEKAKEYMHGEIDRMFGDLARQTRGNSFIKFNHKPTNYKAKSVRANYKEYKVDSELVCPDCSYQFQVFGIFGYCPGCGAENILIYDANFAIIKKDIEASENPERSLRHAYSDLVSAFQIFCSHKAKSITGEKPSFQELYPTRKYFKESASIDILENISEADLLTIRRLFQKRHVFQHAGGEITERYIKKIPEDRALLGQRASLSLEELEKGARAIRAVLDNLCRKFEPK